MNSISYMQRERAEKKAKRTLRFAKILFLMFLLGVPFMVGFFTGRIINIKKETIYNPDPCTLEVVVCEGEDEYSLN